ncbi:hypothetical protein DN730_09715 [Marinomonas piezotolerans]|uniref:Uncharacterized protein n=1 Tax=Marinomonas piezotolerans TaxID=2213058 RepID=A0A370UA45_9GAMM|nr:hypothetical protein [Marinomonas piezotolerans]RDL44652.1 hypothetical protein DN730_09715 [Marinomonas piezotolerans]
MNTKHNWNLDVIAGHDEDSNPITVAQLVAALEGQQYSLDASAETIRALQTQVAELEAGLNHATARLNEQTAA